MAFLPIFVHEMFHALFHARARRTAVAQVDHEAWIARGQSAELRGGHAGAAQEDFDFADEHDGSPSSRGLSRGCESLSRTWSRAKSYLSRKNLSYRTR